MPGEFEALPASLEPLIRDYISKKLRFPAAASVTTSPIRARRIPFYSNAWLGYLEITDSEHAPNPTKYFFAAQQRGKRVRVVPIANAPGCIQRANRELGLRLTRSNAVEYLHYYYSFTPKDDAMLARLGRGPTQFAVPRRFGDIQFNAPEQLSLVDLRECSHECLARGAVWHFLDEANHYSVMPLRLRDKQSQISGRLPIQFRDALFATDFKVPKASGVPFLSNPEPLFASSRLAPPNPLPTALLPLPRKVSLREFWITTKDRCKRIAATWVRHVLRASWWVFSGALLYVWVLSAFFSAFEWLGSKRLRDHVQWVSESLGLASWPDTFFIVGAVGIVLFLVNIFVATHMDKVFNWIFRFCPRRWQSGLAQVLDRGIENWDQRMIAQDTFGKRLGWSTFRLTLWTTYLVFAFATLQIVWDLIWDQRSAPVFRLLATFLSQAVLNIPFVAFLLIRVFGLAPRLDPVADGLVDGQLLTAFQLAMALIVFKGLYRVWVFTVEASPYTFFRRLRQKRGRRPPGS
jgi:hypothetical protein